MSSWSDVERFLAENYESDFGMKMVAGPEAFAAVVNHSAGSEVILVMNVSDVLIQFDGFLDAKAFKNLDKVYSLQPLFGIKKTSSSAALHHIAILETLDAKELTAPLMLMAQEMHKIKTSI